jgi:chromosomal replication initiation ATPase DnaA
VTGQLVLAFDHPPSLVVEDFLVAPCNAEAAGWVERWPDWPIATLVLHGPEACGKTHLAEILLALSKGRLVVAEDLGRIDPLALAAGAPAVVVEGAGGELPAAAEQAFFHLLNAARDAGAKILLTARQPVARWPVRLPDLRSRLMAAAAVEIGAPDDSLLGAVLVKQFRDRQIAIDDAVVGYVLARIERSFAAVRGFVARADRVALAERRAITVPFARELLGNIEEDGSARLPGGGDPFSP